MNIFYTNFDTPFGNSILASLEDKICWLSFRDDGQKFKTFISDYIDTVHSRLTKKDFNRFKDHYPPIARMLVSKDVSVIEDTSRFAEVLSLIKSYFKGKKIDFSSIELVYLEGTPFQQRVWSALRKIKYGEVKSYKDISIVAGNPGASRAVGNANGKNFIPLIIPCHRVIKADNSPGGYSGGLDIKKKLLELEGVTLNW